MRVDLFAAWVYSYRIFSLSLLLKTKDSCKGKRGSYTRILQTHSHYSFLQAQESRSVWNRPFSPRKYIERFLTGIWPRYLLLIVVIVHTNSTPLAPVQRRNECACSWPVGNLTRQNGGIFKIPIVCFHFAWISRFQERFLRTSSITYLI